MRSESSYQMCKANKISLARNWNHPHLPQLRRSLILSDLKFKETVRTKQSKKDDK